MTDTAYLVSFDPELVELNPARLEKLHTGVRIKLRTQIPTESPVQKSKSENLTSRSQFAKIAIRNASNPAIKARKNLHDRAEAERLEEGEVGEIREAGAEDAIVDHREVERRNKEALGHIRHLLSLFLRRRIGGETPVLLDGDFNSLADIDASFVVVGGGGGMSDFRGHRKERGEVEEGIKKDILL